jgi:hypothetical protein
VFKSHLGRVFGGYTTEAWAIEDETKHIIGTKESFLYSQDMNILFRKVDDSNKFAITLDHSVICRYGAGNEDLKICDNCDKKKDSKSWIYNYEFKGDQQLFKG